MKLTAKIEGNELVIRVPLEEKPELSSTGKTFTVATTHGFQATEAVVKHEGKEKKIHILMNAFVKKG